MKFCVFEAFEVPLLPHQCFRLVHRRQLSPIIANTEAV